MNILKKKKFFKEEFSNDFLSKKWLYLENLEKWELDKATKIQEYTQEIERLQDDIE